MSRQIPRAQTSKLDHLKQAPGSGGTRGRGLTLNTFSPSLKPGHFHHKNHSSPDFITDAEMLPVYAYQQMPENSFSTTSALTDYDGEDYDVSEPTSLPMGLSAISINEEEGPTPVSSYNIGGAPLLLTIFEDEGSQSEDEIKKYEGEMKSDSLKLPRDADRADKSELPKDETLDTVDSTHSIIVTPAQEMKHASSAPPSLNITPQLKSDTEPSYSRPPTAASTAQSPGAQPTREAEPAPASSCIFCCCKRRKRPEATELTLEPLEATKHSVHLSTVHTTSTQEDSGLALDPLRFSTRTDEESYGVQIDYDDEIDRAEIDYLYSLSQPKGLASEESRNAGEDFEKNPRRLRIEHVKGMGEELGKGAGGTVIKVLHMPMCNVYAMKKTDLRRKQLAEAEMKMFACVQNFIPRTPQLLQFYDCFVEQDSKEFAVVMDYMNLGSIFDFLDKGGTIDNEQCRHITRECLIALNTLHTLPQPLCHRDVKPDNILLDSAGVVKLADYGLVMQLDAKDARLHEIQGTQKYMSPQRHEGDYSLKEDIWSLGVTVMEIALSEKLPDSQFQVFKIQAGMEDAIPRLDPEQHDPELCDFVNQCLRFKEEERPSAEELLKHPYVNKKSDRVPEFSARRDGVKQLRQIIDVLVDWVNGCQRYLGIEKPFPREDLHDERVQNMSRWTGLDSEEIFTMIHKWVHEEMRRSEGLQRKIRTRSHGAMSRGKVV